MSSVTLEGAIFTDVSPTQLEVGRGRQDTDKRVITHLLTTTHHYHWFIITMKIFQDLTPAGIKKHISFLVHVLWYRHLVVEYFIFILILIFLDNLYCNNLTAAL